MQLMVVKTKGNRITYCGTRTDKILAPKVDTLSLLSTSLRH